MSRLWPDSESMYHAVPATVASNTRKVGTPIANLRRHRRHARVFKVRRASLKEGRFPRLSSINFRTSRLSSCSAGLLAADWTGLWPVAGTAGGTLSEPTPETHALLEFTAPQPSATQPTASAPAAP